MRSGNFWGRGPESYTISIDYVNSRIQRYFLRIALSLAESIMAPGGGGGRQGQVSVIRRENCRIRTQPSRSAAKEWRSSRQFFRRTRRVSTPIVFLPSEASIDSPEVWRSAGACGGGMTIFRYLSAHKESLWTVPIFRQWPLSFRALQCAR